LVLVVRLKVLHQQVSVFLVTWVELSLITLVVVAVRERVRGSQVQATQQTLSLAATAEVAAIRELKIRLVVVAFRTITAVTVLVAVLVAAAVAAVMRQAQTVQEQQAVTEAQVMTLPHSVEKPPEPPTTAAVAVVVAHQVERAALVVAELAVTLEVPTRAAAVVAQPRRAAWAMRVDPG